MKFKREPEPELPAPVELSRPPGEGFLNARLFVEACEVLIARGQVLSPRVQAAYRRALDRLAGVPMRRKSWADIRLLEGEDER